MTRDRETKLLASAPDGLYIGGQWRAASDGATLDVHHSATGEVIRTITSATVDGGRTALDTACEAFPA